MFNDKVCAPLVMCSDEVRKFKPLAYNANGNNRIALSSLYEKIHVISKNNDPIDNNSFEMYTGAWNGVKMICHKPD